MERSMSFDEFRNYMKNELKELGDREFIEDIVYGKDIDEYFLEGLLPESMYTLAMLDYVSRINNVPLRPEYDELRKAKLTEILYTNEIGLEEVMYKKSHEEMAVIELERSIPEFKRFNIVELDVRDAR